MLWFRAVTRTCPDTEILNVRQYRSALCEALVTASQYQDKSSSLLETTASSLLTSFSPHEVTYAVGTPSCTAAVLEVASLSRKGFLEIEQNSQLVVDLISEYALLTNVTAVDYSPVKQRNVNTAVRHLAHKCCLLKYPTHHMHTSTTLSEQHYIFILTGLQSGIGHAARHVFRRKPCATHIARPAGRCDKCTCECHRQLRLPQIGRAHV